jgi:hypothetical protein
VFSGRKTLEDDIGVAGDFAPDLPGDFRSGKWHIWYKRLPVDLVVAAHYKGARIQFNPKFAWRKLCASG